ncbi:CBS domain-containing protein CBSX1, chloroplastic-like [Argentina anserina]|uniref:CBS domain-containing protein CBSX1, chloroplastic-like n=1 Tax=Argentina anserina TaxID=57926 RepID=UPI0021765EB3|nr:CBS domain-containing protein CBSX1, chloroplastic-like [Potentilla anserina]
MASMFIPNPSLFSNIMGSPVSQLSCRPRLYIPNWRPISVSIAVYGNLVQQKAKTGVVTVGDVMTRKENLHVVSPTTTVNEVIELLMEKEITSFPVIDNNNWKLVGVVTDYDLLALATISCESGMFPQVNSCWETFKDVKQLLSKTNGQVVGDVMTSTPIVVRETMKHEDVAGLLLDTKYRRLPVVDDSGKLVGIITRGNIIRAALQKNMAARSAS